MLSVKSGFMSEGLCSRFDDYYGALDVLRV